MVFYIHGYLEALYNVKEWFSGEIYENDSEFDTK